MILDPKLNPCIYPEGNNYKEVIILPECLLSQKRSEIAIIIERVWMTHSDKTLETFVRIR